MEEPNPTGSRQRDLIGLCGPTHETPPLCWFRRVCRHFHPLRTPTSSLGVHWASGLLIQPRPLSTSGRPSSANTNHRLSLSSSVHVALYSCACGSEVKMSLKAVAVFAQVCRAVEASNATVRARTSTIFSPGVLYLYATCSSSFLWCGVEVTVTSDPPPPFVSLRDLFMQTTFSVIH